MLTDDKPIRGWRKLLLGAVKIFRRPEQPQTTSPGVAEDRALVFSLSPSRIPTARQLSYLNQVLSPREKITIRILVAIGVISLIVLISRTIARHVVSLPQDGGTLTEGFVGTPQTINPLLARPFTTDADLSALTFRGLMRVDQNLKVVPDLASRIDVSADGKTYTVTLKTNQQWSDGQPLTAADVQYTIETAADPSYSSPYQSLFSTVTGVTTPNDRTVVITLQDPLEPFRSFLTLGILPVHDWQDTTSQTFALAETNDKPIGNGPYKFQSLTKDRTGNVKSYTFTRQKLDGGVAPHIERIIAKFYPDTATATEALKTHAIDSLGGLSVNDLKKIGDNHRVSKFALSEIMAVFFNQKTNPSLKAKEVRQALALATDKSKIRKQGFQGLGQIIQGPLLPDQAGYNPNLKRSNFNLNQAKDLLTQHGWKVGTSGIRQKGPQQLTFTLTVVDDPTYLAVAKILADDWKLIGVNVEIKPIAPDRIQKDIIRPRNYEALVFGQISNTDADPYALWHSSQARDTGFNLAVTYIPGVDSDVTQARTATDPVKHNQALFDFQNIIAEEVPAIFLTQTEYLYAHPASLRGFPGNRLNTAADRFDGIASWYLKTKLQWK